MYMYVEKYKKIKDKINTRTSPRIETIKAVQTKNQTWLGKSKRKSKQNNRKKCI